MQAFPAAESEAVNTRTASRFSGFFSLSPLWLFSRLVINTTTMRPPLENADLSDSELVAQSLAGDRDAFGRIVTRYQTLLCSLAYSATGSLSQSEDLAQETFVTAWRQLADLRQPEKLRGWLCRISRNLTYDALLKQGREPSHKAQSLDEIEESPRRFHCLQNARSAGRRRRFCGV